MDVTSLLDSGRYDEVVRALSPASDQGDPSASNNIAIAYRRAGDPARETFYALRAYQQEPTAATINTVLRALRGGGNHQAAAGLYKSARSYRHWARTHHLYAADSLLKCNRLEEAEAALARAGDFPQTSAWELSIAYNFAMARWDFAAALAALERLEAVGDDVVSRRIATHFTAGEMRRTLDIYGRLADEAHLAATGKTALLAALALEDKARARQLLHTAQGVPPGVRAAAEALVEGRATVDVVHRGRPYRFPFAASNLSVAICHAGGALYEPQALEALRQLAPKPEVIVDVGANLGNHTAFFAAEMRARVIAFECNPRMAEQLRRTVELNGLEAQVDLSHLGKAVSDQVGEASFNFVRDDFSNIVGAGEGTPVQALTLDSLGLGRCDLLKVDVDGGELKVLAGADQLLRTLRPIVAIEVLATNTAEVMRRMASLGYEVLREDCHYETYGDFLFVPVETRLPA